MVVPYYCRRCHTIVDWATVEIRVGVRVEIGFGGFGFVVMMNWLEFLFGDVSNYTNVANIAEINYTERLESGVRRPHHAVLCCTMIASPHASIMAAQNDNL
jgi:hypothetical protein